MNHTFHCHLRKSLSWYNNWHKHPRNHHTHWLLFVVFVTSASLFISGQINIFESENQYLSISGKAHAQAGLTLGLSGGQFTVNGTPQFLLFISYFDAMNASDATLDSDFSRLRTLGFKGIRMFPDWKYGTSPNILLDANGNFNPGMLSRLTNILDKARNNGIMVDLSFDRTLVDNRDAAAMINGLRNTAQALTSYRNIYFDLTNESDWAGISCGTARFCASEARQARDAVKQVDPNRIVGISVDPSNNQAYVINGGMDLALAHRSLGPLTGTVAYINDVKSQAQGLPLHFQEPFRCRQNPCELPANQYLDSARDTKCAGAAGYNFHTAGAYDLDSRTLFDWGHANNDPSVEDAVANGLNGAVSGVTWNSCSGGGTYSQASYVGGTYSQSSYTGASPRRSRFIFFLNPDEGPAGTPIVIYGENLSSTVQFHDASRNRNTVSGTVNSDGTEVVVNIPAGSTPGNYTIRVGPDLVDVSEEVPFTVTAGTFEPVPTSADPPIINSFSPETVSQGGTVEIFGENLPRVARLTDISSQTTVVLGWVNDDFSVLTISIPVNLTPGNYTIEVTGPNGSATATGTLTVIASSTNTDIGPTATGITPPGSTMTFQDLISNSLSYAVYAVGVAVFMMILYAGFLWTTSAANPGNIAVAKRYITNSVMGAVLLLSSYIILYTINPDLVGGSLTLPTIAPAPQPTNTIIIPPGTGQVDACAACPAYPGGITAGGQSVQCTGLYIDTSDTIPTNNRLGQPPQTCSFAGVLTAQSLQSLKGITTNWVMSEGFPPTVNHLSPCHGNGTCVDIVLTPRPSNTAQLVQELNALCNAAVQAGFSRAGILNEYSSIPLSAWPTGPTGCPPPKQTQLGTGDHLHLVR